MQNSAPVPECTEAPVEERLWAPGEAEAVLREQLEKLGLPEEDVARIIRESLDVEDVD